MRGILLYGPPAAGKDTITRELCELDPAYRLFQRLKAGPGRTAGYRMTDMHEVERLRAEGEVVWENHRYGAVYVIDRPTLRADLTRYTPVLHLGQIEAVQAVKAAVPEALGSPSTSGAHGMWLRLASWLGQQGTPRTGYRLGIRPHHSPAQTLRSIPRPSLPTTLPAKCTNA